VPTPLCGSRPLEPNPFEEVDNFDVHLLFTFNLFSSAKSGQFKCSIWYYPASSQPPPFTTPRYLASSTNAKVERAGQVADAPDRPGLLLRQEVRRAAASGEQRQRTPQIERVPSFLHFFAKFCKFLAGSFSAVSKRNFARKYAFDSIFQALQDLHPFAPLQSQNFRKKSV
jgi:hypothetical protein